jgi:hypothetical protein
MHTRFDAKLTGRGTVAAMALVASFAAAGAILLRFVQPTRPNDFFASRIEFIMVAKSTVSLPYEPFLSLGGRHRFGDQCQVLLASYDVKQASIGHRCASCQVNPKVQQAWYLRSTTGRLAV